MKKSSAFQSVFYPVWLSVCGDKWLKGTFECATGLN